VKMIVVTETEDQRICRKKVKIELAMLLLVVRQETEKYCAFKLGLRHV